METKMGENIYRQLQQKLDFYSMGFPATESGIELRILQYLFSEEDAKLFLSLSHKLEMASTIASSLNQPLEDVADRLDDMAERGLLFRLQKPDSTKYATIPFVHGLFEFQVKNLKRDLAEMVREYFEEAFDASIQESAEYFLRTIPVNRSIDATYNVASYDDAAEILKSKSRIVIADCICRKSAALVDNGCGKSLEACFMFGSMGQYYLDRDMGREIALDEALDILVQCREEGLVTQPATSQNPSGMCNCCGDCCGVLKALNRSPKPAEMVFSNYRALVESDKCTGCETCLDRCQMNALEINDNEVAQVNKERCIGCGLCVTTCETEAMRLIPKSDTEYQVPPASSAEQMMLMAKKRGLI
jgi:Pyruvate/2-oxoacid:ferredoxin oxidoreductase delta subunit